MNLEQALKVLDQAIKNLAQKDGLSYVDAFQRLVKDKPDLFKAVDVVRRREEQQTAYRKVTNG